jgi:hypothetical protein
MSGHGCCAICSKHDYLMPLHGDKGGPGCCLLCMGAWHAEHGRRIRLGRIVIRAIAAYLDGGGKWEDLDKLKLSAGTSGLIDLDPLGYMADTAGTAGEIVELTSELLADAIRLVHPDLHPPERRELAKRVTQGLLALQPFVFPAPKPEPAIVHSSEPRNGSSSGPELTRRGAVTYPCKECADSIPYFYCDPCRTEFDNRNQKELDRASARRRALRAERKASRSTLCACGVKFKGKRTDARFCSDACRQRAHRKSVTAKTKASIGASIQR